MQARTYVAFAIVNGAVFEAEYEAAPDMAAHEAHQAIGRKTMARRDGPGFRADGFVPLNSPRWWHDLPKATA